MHREAILSIYIRQLWKHFLLEGNPMNKTNVLIITVLIYTAFAGENLVNL